jgi:ABC-2 type transport system permease protein
MKTWRHELLLLGRETAWWAILAGYIAMLVYGSLQSLDRVARQKKQVAAAVFDYHARWDKLRREAGTAGERVWSDTRSASLVGGPLGFAIVALPVDGTSVLSSGESLRLSRVRSVSIYPNPAEPPIENPLIKAAGTFDLSFVVLWLLPLSILAATYGSVSGSRASGTWPLVVVNSSNPSAVAFRRVFLPACLLCGATCLAGAIAIHASGGTSASGWLRTSVWALCVSAYGGIWAALSRWVNSWAISPEQAIRGLGLIWLASVWIVPASLDELAGLWVRPVSRLEADPAAREVQRDLPAKLGSMLENVYKKHPEWRPSAEAVAAANKPVPGGPASRDARRVYTPSLAAAEATRDIEQAIVRRQEAIEVLAFRWSILSPVLAMQYAGDFLAGTSSRQFAQLDKQAAQATDAWHAFFRPRIFLLKNLTLEDLNEIPRFGQMVPDYVWNELLLPAMTLALWLAVACCAAWRGGANGSA